MRCSSFDLPKIDRLRTSIGPRMVFGQSEGFPTRVVVAQVSTGLRRPTLEMPSSNQTLSRPDHLSRGQIGAFLSEAREG